MSEFRNLFPSEKKIMRVVVCDLDDTLFPEIQYAESGFAAVGQHLIKLKTQGVLDATFKIYSANDFATSCMQLHQEGVRGDVFDRLLISSGCNERARHGTLSNNELIKEMVRAYRYHRPSISLHTDALNLFKRYSSLADSCLGIITNGLAAVQRLKIEALGLERWCNHIIFCEDLGVQKPSKIPYQHMMDLCGPEYDGGDFLYVGDHPVKDFIGARECGWKTARIIRENGLHGHVVPPEGIDADIIITSLNYI